MKTSAEQLSCEILGEFPAVVCGFLACESTVRPCAWLESRLAGCTVGEAALIGFRLSQGVERTHLAGPMLYALIVNASRACEGTRSIPGCRM